MGRHCSQPPWQEINSAQHCKRTVPDPDSDESGYTAVNGGVTGTLFSHTCHCIHTPPGGHSAVNPYPDQGTCWHSGVCDLYDRCQVMLESMRAPNLIVVAYGNKLRASNGAQAFTQARHTNAGQVICCASLFISVLRKAAYGQSAAVRTWNLQNAITIRVMV